MADTDPMERRNQVKENGVGRQLGNSVSVALLPPWPRCPDRELILADAPITLGLLEGLPREAGYEAVEVAAPRLPQAGNLGQVLSPNPTLNQQPKENPEMPTEPSTYRLNQLANKIDTAASLRPTGHGGAVFKSAL